jgi:hypothetical protein
MNVGRVINPESAGKERIRLVKGTVLAMRELMRQTQPDEASQDLAAFIALALLEIAEGIDTSVLAWEKKGYWVKADRFRLEWDWTARLGDQMRAAILSDDWAGVARTAVQVGGKLMNIQVAEHHRLGTPWVGAYRKLAGR